MYSTPLHIALHVNISIESEACASVYKPSTQGTRMVSPAFFGSVSIPKYVTSNPRTFLGWGVQLVETHAYPDKRSGVEAMARGSCSERAEL